MEDSNVGKLIWKQINLFKNHLERPPSLKKSEKNLKLPVPQI